MRRATFDELKNQIEGALTALPATEGENKRVLLRRIRKLLVRADQTLAIVNGQASAVRPGWANLRALVTLALHEDQGEQVADLPVRRRACQL